MREVVEEISQVRREAGSRHVEAGGAAASLLRRTYDAAVAGAREAATSPQRFGPPELGMHLAGFGFGSGSGS
ncbi:hypothetical protein [Streptomyces sp. NPDC048269]|uniref:hypothetical protein n=1 Tax=Streptomyces sp. NPDC048269 TaxID=3155753 RepID=UPI00341F601D